MYIAIDVCRYFLYIDHFYSEFGVTLPILEKIMFQISDNNELKILNYLSYTCIRIEVMNRFYF